MVCSEVHVLGPNRVAGMKNELAKEWVHSLVRPYGDTKIKQNGALRKKINRHKIPDGHMEAEKLKRISEEGVLTELFVQQETGNIC